MEWKDWIGKKVFIKTKSGKIFSNSLIDSIDDSDKPIIFISLVDKYGQSAMVVSSEILVIQEDRKDYEM